MHTKTLKSGGLVGYQVCIPRSNADVNTCLRMGFGICLPVSVGSVLPFLLHPVLLTVVFHAVARVDHVTPVSPHCLQTKYLQY